MVRGESQLPGTSGRLVTLPRHDGSGKFKQKIRERGVGFVLSTRGVNSSSNVNN